MPVLTSTGQNKIDSW